MQSSPRKKIKYESKSFSTRTQYKTSRSIKTMEQNPHSQTQQRSKFLMNFARENEEAELQYKLAVQNNILKEYETWVYTLLTVISEKERNDGHINIGTMIQKGLERIEKLKEDNYEIKYKIASQQERNLQESQRKKELEAEMKNIQDDIKNEYIAIVNNDNIRLKGNIQFLADELDSISELRDKLKEKASEINLKEYYDTLKEYNDVKYEWNVLQKIIEYKKKMHRTMNRHHNHNDSNLLSSVRNNGNGVKRNLINCTNDNALFIFDSEDDIK